MYIKLEFNYLIVRINSIQHLKVQSDEMNDYDPPLDSGLAWSHLSIHLLLSNIPLVHLHLCLRIYSLHSHCLPLHFIFHTILIFLFPILPSMISYVHYYLTVHFFASFHLLLFKYHHFKNAIKVNYHYIELVKNCDFKQSEFLEVDLFYFSHQLQLYTEFHWNSVDN